MLDFFVKYKTLQKKVLKFSFGDSLGHQCVTKFLLPVALIQKFPVPIHRSTE